jgi:hypothetical protein
MTDPEVQAISQFLLKFGYLGCYQITVCRRNVEKLSRDQIGQAVLDIREAWKREGLDVERLYKVAVLAHQYCADQDECLPGCCGPWGEIEPVMPPGPGAALTVNQFYQARMRAVAIRPQLNAPTGDEE